MIVLWICLALSVAGLGRPVRGPARNRPQGGAGRRRVSRGSTPFPLAAIGGVATSSAPRAAKAGLAPRHPRSTLPPVSILKPLKGADACLEENLESFYRLDYPEYEIIFSFASRDDAAFPVARRVADRHPDVLDGVRLRRSRAGPQPESLAPPRRGVARPAFDPPHLRRRRSRRARLPAPLRRGIRGSSRRSRFEPFSLRRREIGRLHDRVAPHERIRPRRHGRGFPVLEAAVRRRESRSSFAERPSTGSAGSTRSGITSPKTSCWEI